MATETNVELRDHKIKSLGLEGSVQVPATVEAFDTLAGKQGACLSEAINNVIYRSFLAQLRGRFVERLQEETGIERRARVTGTKKVKNEAGEEVEEDILAYDESEKKYVDRVCAEQNVDISTYQPLFDEIANELSFDPSATERSSKPKKIADQYVKVAQSIIDQGAAETVAEKLSEKLGMAVEATLDSLAAAVAEDQRRKRQQVVDEYINDANE